MKVLTNILFESWNLTVEMAPYLLFGFLFAGILSELISKEYVRRHLGGRGFFCAFKAALIGVPMPICSCGVIPLAATLRKHGASRGATASFLASTPQTGVDSLLITTALLGWVFAVFRILAAFLSGIICGMAVEQVPASPDEEKSPDTSEQKPVQNGPIALRMLRYGFLTLPQNISKSLFMGIIISGILSSLIPDNFLSSQAGQSPMTMFLMLIIGIPLYVCSSASVPIALAFIKAGISPGAALVFLITGPATNTATLTTLWKIIGKKQLIVFLITLSIIALISGFFMNLFEPTLGIHDIVCHKDTSCNALSTTWAITLILLLINGIRRQNFNS